jgi:peptidoglycan/LPS O-acetylase OafA/YrhL
LTRGETPLLSIERNIKKVFVFLGILSSGVVVLWKFSPQSSTFGMQSIGYTWMALFYAVILVLGIGHQQGWIARLLRTRWLRELGVVSYCVYIIHIVVNVVLHAVLLHKVPRISTGKGAAVTVFAAFVTYGVAKMSWLLLETPLQRRGHAKFKY